MFHKVVWQHMQGVLGCLINNFMQIYEVILQWILAELRPWVCVATFWPTLYIQEAPILPATALLYWRSGGSASGSWLATRYMARRLSLQTPGMFKYRSRKGKYSCSKVIWTFLTPDRQGSFRAGTHRNAVPVLFLITGTPFRSFSAYSCKI